MKPFTQYLQELNRDYDFSIKIAGCDFTTEMQDRLKSALAIYSLESMGKPKSLPIQEHVDFPGQGPCECNIVDVCVKYPVITDQLAQVVAEKLSIPRKNVIVRTKGQEESAMPAAAPITAKDGSVLNNPELEYADGAQALVGEQRKESMLKELESRKYEFAETPARAKEEKMPMGNVSPVGSLKIKIPSPIKGK
jgi:hypothetical protein